MRDKFIYSVFGLFVGVFVVGLIMCQALGKTQPQEDKTAIEYEGYEIVKCELVEYIGDTVVIKNYLIQRD